MVVLRWNSLVGGEVGRIYSRRAVVEIAQAGKGEAGTFVQALIKARD